MSGPNNGNYGNPPVPGTGHSKGAYFNHNGNMIWLRSSYETRLARALTNAGIIWDYEIKTFVLEINGRKTTYRPDFYLFEYNTWIDTKGFLWPKSKEKIKEFYKTYGENLLVLYEDDIEQFEYVLNEDTESVRQWLVSVPQVVNNDPSH
jgi:hypothetical protein